jgi:RES domain-containing protein
MFLWRISNHSSLDGRGGLLASGRWHTRGKAVVYLAETAAGALLEALVHLELDYGNLPETYGLLKAEAPDSLRPQNLDVNKLTDDWVKDQIATRTAGDEWLSGRKTVLLRVPSAIVPETGNVLLNPEHAEAGKIRVVWYRPYPWDRRLLA